MPGVHSPVGGVVRTAALLMSSSIAQFRLVGRSYVLFVLMPESPLAGWLMELDAWRDRSPGFFDEKPVLLDLSRHALSKAELADLIGELRARNVTLVALDGVHSGLLDADCPPLLSGGRPAAAPDAGDRRTVESDAEGSEAAPEPTSLLLDRPVRSGQSIVFTNGDVTVLGSIASGAEVVAGGSIHVYGALRGRALAGVSGYSDAQIFCRDFDAELVAIGGIYTNLIDRGPGLAGRPVHVRLVQDSLQMRVLD